MTSSGKSNEQEVIRARDKIESLKSEYISILTPIVLNKNEKDIDPSLEELLECKKRANAYFNYVENFVGNSGLLGAHDNGLWVTGFAEDCLAILETIVIHYDFLRSYGEVFSGVNIEPSKSSYANMQRIVVEYLPKKTSKTIKQTFEKHSLPTAGFIMPASEDVKKTPTWQIVTGIVFGVIALISSILLSIYIPEPSPWQMFVFRGAFAIGLASIAPIIPGFINLTSKITGRGSYFKIVAGGSIAIFVLIWLVNPPKM